MASSFGQYQGGIAPVQGIAEAGARIAQMNQQGLSSLGQSLGEGLKAYNENKAKDQILTQEAEALGQQIQQYAKMFGNSPEHAEFSKSLQPYIDQLAKVPSQSLTQKMGTVTGVKAGFANIGQQLQVFELMRKEKLQRTMAEAGYLAPKDSLVYNPSALKAGTVAYDPSKSATQNVSDFDALIKKAQSEGHEIDAEDARQRYLANIKQSIESDQKIDPRLKATLKDQLESYKPYQENAMTDESGVTDYAKEAELYANVETSALDKMKQGDATTQSTLNADALKRFTDYQGSLEKDVASLIEEQNKIKGEIKTAEDLAPFTPKKSIAQRVGGSVIDFVKNMSKETLASSIKTDDKGNPVLDEKGKPEYDIEKILKNYTNLAVSSTFSGLSAANPISSIYRGVDELTSEGLSPVQQLERDKKIAKLIGSNLTPEQRLKENEIRLQQTKDMLSTVQAQTGKVSEALGQQPIQPEQPAVAPIVTKQDMVVGSKADVRPATFDEKKQAMQEYFMSKYKDASGKSYLPAGFDEAFKASNPEANFKTMETPYGAFMWNGKEWTQVKMEKGMNTKEQREAMRGVFGTQTDKGFVPLQVGEGTGVKIHGVFTGSDAELGKYKDNISAMASARSAIAELRSIVGQFGHSLSPTLIGRAKIAMATLRAATRIEVIGVGTVSEMEQKMLNDANPDTTKTFSLDSVDIAKLDSLSRKIDNKMKMESTMNGVTVILQPPTFGSEGRQAIEEGLRQRNPQLYRR